MNIDTRENCELAVLCWEKGHVPRGLRQLEELPGNSTNPATYPFPVRFSRIEGANIETVLENPSKQVLQRMIEEGKRLAAEGVRAVTTSCGFNAVFQQELSDALDIQVFTSSLLQVPFVHSILPRNGKVGIITAKKKALRAEHLQAAGIAGDMKIEIFGLENCAEWNKIFIAPDDDLDMDIISREVLDTARSAVNEHPEIKGFVLECTDLPPFAPLIRKSLNLPVYDFTTLVRLAASSLGIIPTF